MSTAVIEPKHILAGRNRYVALIRQHMAGYLRRPLRPSPRVAKHPLRVLFDANLEPLDRFLTEEDEHAALEGVTRVMAVRGCPASEAEEFCTDVALTLLCFRASPKYRLVARTALAILLTGFEPLLKVLPTDNPEPVWYHELLLMHLLASFAWESGEIAAIDSIALRAASFHWVTQPDHATTEPWAIHAFAPLSHTHYTADTILHAAEMNAITAGHHLVALMALRDALYSLEQYRPDSAKGSNV